MTSPFETIDVAVLETVSGGRKTHVAQIDPALITGIQGLTEAVSAVGQTLAATKQQSEAGKMQMLQQLMQVRSGR